MKLSVWYERVMEYRLKAGSVVNSVGMNTDLAAWAEGAETKRAARSNTQTPMDRLIRMSNLNLKLKPLSNLVVRFPNV
jgi:hypothetical protein